MSTAIEWIRLAEKALDSLEYSKAADYCLIAMEKEPQNQYVKALNIFAVVHRRYDGRYSKLGTNRPMPCVCDQLGEEEKINENIADAINIMSLIASVASDDSIEKIEKEKIANYIFKEIAFLQSLSNEDVVYCKKYFEQAIISMRNSDADIWNDNIMVVENRRHQSELNPQPKQVTENKQEQKEGISFLRFIAALSFIAGIVSISCILLYWVIPPENLPFDPTPENFETLMVVMIVSAVIGSLLGLCSRHFLKKNNDAWSKVAEIGLGMSLVIIVLFIIAVVIFFAAFSEKSKKEAEAKKKNQAKKK